MSLMESLDGAVPLDPAAYMSEPEVTTEPDGTLVFSVKAAGLDVGSIVVEHDGGGRCEAKAAASETIERQSVETHFAFEFELPADISGAPAWAYTDGILRITIPPR
jgi:hypothetical protein